MRIYIIDDCKSELMCWQRTLEMHTDWEHRLEVIRGYVNQS